MRRRRSVLDCYLALHALCRLCHRDQVLSPGVLCNFAFPFLCTVTLHCNIALRCTSFQKLQHLCPFLILVGVWLVSSLVCGIHRAGLDLLPHLPTLNVNGWVLCPVMSDGRGLFARQLFARQGRLMVGTWVLRYIERFGTCCIDVTGLCWRKLLFCIAVLRLEFCASCRFYPRLFGVSPHCTALHLGSPFRDRTHATCLYTYTGQR